MPRQFQARRTRPGTPQSHPTKQQALFAQEQLFCFQLELLANPKFVASESSSKIKGIRTKRKDGAGYQLGRLHPDLNKNGKNIYMLLGAHHLVDATDAEIKNPNDKAIQDTFLKLMCKEMIRQEDFDRERISAFGFHPRNLMDDPRRATTLSAVSLPCPQDVFTQIAARLSWANPSKRVQQKHLTFVNDAINQAIWKANPLRPNIRNSRMERLSSKVAQFQDLLTYLPDSEEKALDVFDEAVGMAVHLIRLFYQHPDEMLDLLTTVWELFACKRRRMPHRIKIGSEEYMFLFRLEVVACGFVFPDYLSDEKVDFWKHNIELMQFLSQRFFEMGEKDWLDKLYNRYFVPTQVLIEHHVGKRNFDWLFLQRCDRTLQNYMYLASDHNRCSQCSGFVTKEVTGNKCSSCDRLVHYECFGCEYPTKNTVVQCSLHDNTFRGVDIMVDHETKQCSESEDDTETDTESEPEKAEDVSDESPIEIVVHESQEFLPPSDTDEEMQDAPNLSAPLTRRRASRGSPATVSRFSGTTPPRQGFLEYFEGKQASMVERLSRLENVKGVVDGDELKDLYAHFNAYKAELFMLMDCVSRPLNNKHTARDDDGDNTMEDLDWRCFVATTTPYHVVLEIKKQEEILRGLRRQIEELEQQKRSLMGWLGVMENGRVLQIDESLNGVDQFGNEQGILHEIGRDVKDVQINLRAVVKKISAGILRLSARVAKEHGRMDELKSSAKKNKFLPESQRNTYCATAHKLVRDMGARTSRLLNRFSRQIKHWTLNDFEIWLEFVMDGRFASYSKNKMANVDGTRGFCQFLEKECEDDLLFFLHSWGVHRWSDREDLQQLLAVILGR